MSSRPGVNPAKRTLRFIYMVDCSGSMEGQKIQTVNHAIHEIIPAMIDEANKNPYANVQVQVVRFSNGASWHVAKPVDLSAFRWQNVSAGGVTDMGRALRLVAEEFEQLAKDKERGLPPVIVLLSDGQPTDDFETGLNHLLSTPWGKKSVRIAIAIGEDADVDLLHKFMGGHVEMRPLRANNAEKLVESIRWASTIPLRAASVPPTIIKPSLTEESESEAPPPLGLKTPQSLGEDDEDKW